MIEIVEADDDDRVAESKALIQEYAESLGFDLCFQNFDQELDGFPGQYGPPEGRLFLALAENKPVGCVGLRPFEKGICEMKRLYVKPDFRKRKVGRRLVEAVINAANIIGYEVMRLDTLPAMESANLLYRSLGFRQIRSYRHNPIKGAIYMELPLVSAGAGKGRMGLTGSAL